jgi:hypothetical protein
MTKAFDLASFVPAQTPAVGDGVKVTALGPPETTAWTPAFPEAPNDAKLYTRQSKAWVADPIQADAPDTNAYARKNGAWVNLSATTGPPEAPTDGQTYGRANLAWTPVVPLTGATLTGTLTLAGNPVNAADASNKGYVDTTTSAAVATANSYTDSAIAAVNVDAGTY